MAPLITQSTAQRPLSWGVATLAPLAFSMLLAAGPTVTVPIAREHAPERVISSTSGTIKSAQWVSTASGSSLPGQDLTVENLRELSGLSASELGRIFGVSRRSINNWLAGGPMAEQHQARLIQVSKVILGLAAPSPAVRRAALLDSSEGTSLFHQMVAQAPVAQRIQGNALAAIDQF
jgi:transcriptional regulator with XRE-family HTH domain